MAYTPSSSNTNGLPINPEAYGVGPNGAGSQFVAQTVYDLFPTDLVQLFEQNSEGIGWRMLVKLMGFSRGVTAPTTGHYETGRVIDHLVVGSVVTPSAGPGTNVVIELDASSMFTFTDSLGNTQTGSYPRVKDVIKTKGNSTNSILARVEAKDTTVNPHRLTLRPVVSTQDLVGKLTAGERYWIVTRAFAEGTDIGTALQPNIIKYSNTFQLIKEAAISTGSNLATKPYWEPIPGNHGSVFLKNTKDMNTRFETACDNALLFGEQFDNITETPTELGYTVNVSGTEGMITYLENYAFQDFIIPGLQQIQNFDDVTNLLTKERVLSNDYLVLQGIDAYQTYENVFADYSSKWEPGFVIDAREEDGIPEIEIKVGAYGIKKGGFMYRLKSFNAFNDGKGAATTGYGYPNYSVFVPVGYITEKQTGTDQPTVGYEYRMLQGYSRENLLVQTDGTGYTPVTTTTVDIYKVGMVSELASHCTCANNCVIQQPQ